jgi:hypothetical protein
LLPEQHICARPPVVPHGHVKQGSTRPSLLNTKSLCTSQFLLPFCCLPCRWIALATGLTGAAHAAPGHASSRTTSITLHLHFCAGLRSVELKKEHVLRWGKTLESEKPSPNHQRHAQLCNRVLSLKAQQPGSERTSAHGYSNPNLVRRYPASNLQP